MFGADREVVLAVGILCAGLAITAQSIPVAIVCVSLFMGTLYGLRFAAKADPQMRPVYMRYIMYKPYYFAQSRPARETAIKSAVSADRR